MSFWAIEIHDWRKATGLRLVACFESVKLLNDYSWIVSVNYIHLNSLADNYLLYRPLQTEWFSWTPLSEGDGVCCLRGSRWVIMSVKRLYSCTQSQAPRALDRQQLWSWRQYCEYRFVLSTLKWTELNWSAMTCEQVTRRVTYCHDICVCACCFRNLYPIICFNYSLFAMYII